MNPTSEKSAIRPPGSHQQHHAKKKIIILGLANAGKSAIFNMFSTAYSEVANYPHSTVTLIRNECVIAGETFEIWDTPGLGSLHVFSADERQSLNALINEKPDVILFAADSTRLKRSLTLFSQIAELSVPTVFVLNKSDAAVESGMAIDIAELSQSINTPVIITDASRETGLAEMERAIREAKPLDGVVQLPHPAIDEAIDSIIAASEREPVSRGEALLLLGASGRTEEILLEKFGAETVSKANDIARTMRRKVPAMDLRQAVFNAREKWADRVAEKALTADFSAGPGISYYAGYISRHPVWGWPVLLGVMWFTFMGVAKIAQRMADFLHFEIFTPVIVAISNVTENSWLNDFLVGPYGIVTMGIMNAMETVAPILLVFFLIVGLLEEVGYLPNLSVLANRMFSYLGLTGKAVLSVSLGFGCNTMATMTSRMLETRKERVIAAFLIALGVPCAVQLGVMLAILAASPFSALVIVVGTVAAVQIISGYILNKTLKSDRPSDFIMELPAFKAPDFKNIVRKTWYRVKSFFAEALPMFVVGAMLIFSMEKTGLLEIVKKTARPLVTGLLSLPDKATEVLILVLARRELGAVYFKNMVDAGELSYRQIVVGLVVMTLFIPCISNTMMMIKELGLKTAIYVNGSIIIISIAVGTALNGALALLI